MGTGNWCVVSSPTPQGEKWPRTKFGARQTLINGRTAGSSAVGDRCRVWENRLDGGEFFASMSPKLGDF